MNIDCIAVGKHLSPELDAVYSDYVKRLSRWFKLQTTLLSSSKSRDPQQIISEESQSILQSIKDTDFVVLLDERGQQCNSIEFSAHLDKWRAQHKSITFVIGGAFGVSDELRTRANYVWSLSRLVFPHELVRILLVEQLYRGMAITSNLPYHHQ